MMYDTFFEDFKKKLDEKLHIKFEIDSTYKGKAINQVEILLPFYYAYDKLKVLVGKEKFEEIPYDSFVGNSQFEQVFLNTDYAVDLVIKEVMNYFEKNKQKPCLIPISLEPNTPKRLFAYQPNLLGDDGFIKVRIVIFIKDFSVIRHRHKKDSKNKLSDLKHVFYKKEG